MKVLLATYWTIPHLGGVWNYMVQLKQKLEELGHEVDLLGYGDDNNSVHIVNKGKKVEKEKLLPIVKSKINPQTHPEVFKNKLVEYTEIQRYVYELAALNLGLNQYDIIHTQDVISTACINRIRPAYTPLVATLHGSVAHEVRMQLETIHKSETSYMAREYYDDLEKIGASTAEVTIVANQWLKNILVYEFGVKSEQIKILHYGYDTENFIRQVNQKTEIERPIDKKVIIFTGRLVDVKGVHTLISALGKLKKYRNDWVCWLVGTGDKQAELRIQCKVQGVEGDVVFMGSRDDIPNLLSKSDIFVLPSILDNQPLSLIEAQISGKPAIVSDVGGLPEMVENNVTGFVIPKENPDILCDKLEILLGNEQLRKKFGTNAKNWGMTHWSLERGVRGLLDIYSEAIVKRLRNIKG
ncbi:glycosyltransferase family 4 protein [Bacillus massilinigeriensis]|uniref:glycosyltransferase family 4 protein n=1 Tax=Bacillus massilionigeriensis TaxID=1805475 RepID=UPI00096B2841|nr:glycosyltransferase family 4 protein [Bacillus massilionigeriensis]